jgi:hypothetical protein
MPRILGVFGKLLAEHSLLERRLVVQQRRQQREHSKLATVAGGEGPSAHGQQQTAVDRMAHHCIQSLIVQDSALIRQWGRGQTAAEGQRRPRADDRASPAYGRGSRLQPGRGGPVLATARQQVGGKKRHLSGDEKPSLPASTKQCRFGHKGVPSWRAPVLVSTMCLQAGPNATFRDALRIHDFTELDTAMMIKLLSRSAHDGRCWSSASRGRA